jgi:tRNA-(ms[2]io[6]A)-hydroxylase
MITLQLASSEAWIAAVLADFDAFLLDHAANERKASSMAMTFVLRYPDRDAILEPMIQLAREELTHFHRVFKLMQARGLRFQRDRKDIYMKSMISQIQSGRDAEFLDRLLMAAVVEARGCERFTTLAGALEDPALRDFYTEIAQSEARHETLFVDLAAEYFSSEEIAARLSFWIDQDAQILSRLPAQPILH